LNSLPPFAANIDHSDHPALESLAAYLDGRLPEAERPEIAVHLDSCAACYEIYTESLRFQNEERSQTRRTVLPFTRRKSWIPPQRLRALALPFAAVLLAGTGVAVWHQLHLPLELRSVETFTASLGAPGTALTEQLGPFDVNRGVEEESTANYPIVAFQSGATLVDLRLAIEAGDPEKIDLFAQSLGVLYNRTSNFSPEPEKAMVQAAVGRFREGARPARKVRLADFRSLETILRTNNSDEILAPHFQLGAWTEAGRLAAYGGRAAFFAASENRQSLRWFRSNPPIPEVQEPLRRIEDAWPEGSLTPPVKAQLTRRFEQVIEPYNISPVGD
jgi:hypothetical protein